MRLIALWLGKIVFYSLKIFGRRGAALPGLVAEKIYPKFLAKSLDLLPDGVVIITGTNGKTTSTKMLAQVLKPERRVLTNPTGSNFTRGIASSVVQKANLLGKLHYDIGVFELDEAYAALFAKDYSPRATIALNVMRDQMDRFGEIDHTARLIGEIIKKSTEFVVLNRDDQRVIGMRKLTSKQVITFGVSDNLKNIFKNDDELHVPGSRATTKEVADIELTSINRSGEVQYTISDKSLTIKLLAHGTHNAQNAAAVIITAIKIGLSVDEIATKISSVKAAFGRGEKINIGNTDIYLQLVKNPGGFRHALISGDKLNPQKIMIAINDDYADGRDVSWLWDVDFTHLNKGGIPVITTGVRADDMALRLKYDGIGAYDIEPNLEDCIKKHVVGSGDCTIIIYTTYTAMLNIRKLLSSLTEVEKI